MKGWRGDICRAYWKIRLDALVWAIMLKRF